MKSRVKLLHMLAIVRVIPWKRLKMLKIKAFDLAEMNLSQSDEAIKKAHEIHTSLLVEEARNPGCIPASMMLIHASNHLSGAELTNELAKRFVRVYQTR